jgi:Xaa-Pro aminopeptidase
MASDDAEPAAPARGFPEAEFQARTERAQRLMAERGLDALLLSTEPEVRYFSGFMSQFWESPTRPWFLILPLKGRPIAVIPEIGASGMAATWVEDIRTWPAPRPEDDGVSLLAAALGQAATRFGRIGVPMGHESHLRMPAADFAALAERMGNLEIADATEVLRRLRNVKSAAEIDKIRTACRVTSAAFEALPSWAQIGASERAVCRKLRIDLLERGADASPYLIAASGPGGYDNIIMGPTDRVLGEGDVLIIDTGTTYDGYFCDFDRNFAFGPPSESARRAHEVVYRATEAGIAAARPGATTSDLWGVMWAVLEAGGALGESVGRLGHGLGMQLTEGPSNKPGDHTPLEPGMVITIEPGMEFAPGKLMVHEENIAITEGEPELLSRRAPPEMPVIS